MDGLLYKDFPLWPSSKMVSSEEVENFWITARYRTKDQIARNSSCRVMKGVIAVKPTG